MEYSFKTNHRKKMGFDFIPPNMVFSTKEKMSTYPPTINLTDTKVFMDNYLIFDWPNNKTQMGEFRVSPKKPMDGFSRRIPFCDPFSASLWLVGGFVGSKSQAGGSSHRGSEVFRVWDAIQSCLPEVWKEGSKVPPSQNYNPSQFEAVRGLGKSFKSVIPDTAKRMNKSYAEVTKMGIADQSYPCRQGDKSELQTPSVEAKVCDPSPKTDSAIIQHTVVNCKPTIEEEDDDEEVHVQNYAQNSRTSSFSSDSESSEPNFNTSSRKNRTLSDCSIDSDDSFIVFESNEEETGSVDSYSDDESSSDDNDEVDFPKTGRSSEVCSTSSCLSLVNSQWNKCYSTSVEDMPKKNSQKKVSFAKDLTKVQMIIVWDFAYRSARKGPWEDIARDSARFKERIRRAESVLSPVLNPQHRTEVYNLRFRPPD